MKLSLTLSAALLVLSTGAAAQDPEGPGKPRRGFDPERMELRGERMFDAADADGDGLVTEAEFMAAEPPRGRRGRGPAGGEFADDVHAEMFKALDTDGDGQISEAEFARLREVMHEVMKARLFARLDSDGDGVLTRAELSARRDRWMPPDAGAAGEGSDEESPASKSE